MQRYSGTAVIQRYLGRAPISVLLYKRSRYLGLNTGPVCTFPGAAVALFLIAKGRLRGIRIGAKEQTKQRVKRKCDSAIPNIRLEVECQGQQQHSAG